MQSEYRLSVGSLIFLGVGLNDFGVWFSEKCEEGRDSGLGHSNIWGKTSSERSLRMRTHCISGKALSIECQGMKRK